jgi:hypothetical protein
VQAEPLVGEIDRRKHDIDVLERVLGDIRTEGEESRRTEVVSLDVNPGLVSSVSTVQVTVGGVTRDEPSTPREADRSISKETGEPPDDYGSR